jgi:cell division protein FtsA
MSTIHAAIELGTTNTVLAIGKTQDDGRMRIISLNTIPSSGIKKSQVVELKNVTQSILSVLRESEKTPLEKGSKLTIGNAHLVLSGTHINIEHMSSSTSVTGKITQENIDEAKMSLINAIESMGNNRELVDVEYLGFEVDEMGGISDPLNMSGHVLKYHAIRIDADANCIENARTAADQAKIELNDSIFAVHAASEAVLEEHEKKNGVLIIDFGGGTTSYAVYMNNHLYDAGTIGVGGKHVTNDIAHAFQISHSNAESLKINEASALANEQNNLSPRVKLPHETSIMENRTFSRSALNTVTNARLRELLTIIRNLLREKEILHKLHSGAVIIGGGAQMQDIPQLISQVLGLNARFGVPIHIDGLENIDHPERYASIAGALLNINRNHEEKSLFDIFKRIFK